MRLRNVKVENINFTGGINAWNYEAAKGTDSSAGWNPSHSMTRRELPEGFMEDIVNFRFDEEGNLIQRGYVRPFDIGAGLFPSASTRQVQLMTREPQGGTIGSQYLVGYFNGTTVTFIGTGYNVSFTDAMVNGANEWYAIRYNIKWYVYSHAASSFIVLDATVATKVSLPVDVSGLSNVLVWKNRAWAIHNSYEIRYSKATDPGVWASPDGGFFKLPTHESVADIIVYNDQLYIVDTLGGVWVFNYSTDPGADGYIRQIIKPGTLIAPPASSANFVKTKCFAISNGNLYISTPSNVYHIVNDRVFSIADQLHLELNQQDRALLVDLGYGLLLSTGFNRNWVSFDDWNPVHYVYHHSTKSWTRYTFDLFPDIAYSNYVFLQNAHMYSTGNEVKCLLQFYGKLPPGSTGYVPLMELAIDDAFNSASVQDAYIDVFDGNGGKGWREPQLKIKTGPLYLGHKTQFKKFCEFMVDGFFALLKDGTNPNKTPLKTTVDLIPNSIADKVNNTLQITPSSDPTEYVYRIPIYQRARAVQLTFEREDFNVTGSPQEADTAGENPSTYAYVSGLYVTYRPTDSHRQLSSATAYNDSATK